MGTHLTDVCTALNSFGADGGLVAAFSLAALVNGLKTAQPTPQLTFLHASLIVWVWVSPGGGLKIAEPML